MVYIVLYHLYLHKSYCDLQVTIWPHITPKNTFGTFPRRHDHQTKFTHCCQVTQEIEAWKIWLQSFNLIEEVSSASFTDPLLFQDSSSGLSSSFLPSGDGAVLPHLSKLFQTMSAGQFLLSAPLRYASFFCERSWGTWCGKTHLVKQNCHNGAAQSLSLKEHRCKGSYLAAIRLSQDIKPSAESAYKIRSRWNTLVTWRKRLHGQLHPRNCRKKLMRLRIRSKVSLLKTEYLGHRNVRSGMEILIPCSTKRIRLQWLQIDRNRPEMPSTVYIHKSNP